MSAPLRLARPRSKFKDLSSYLMPPLRLFEVASIVRFLTTKEKLVTMARLNQDWYRLISLHCSCASFPELGLFTLPSSYLSYYDSFTNLKSIKVPNFPGEMLTSERLSKLASADLVMIKELSSLSYFNELTEKPDLLKVLDELEVNFNSRLDQHQSQIFLRKLGSVQIQTQLTHLTKLSLVFDKPLHLSLSSRIKDEDEISFINLSALRELEFKIQVEIRTGHFYVQLSGLPKYLEVLSIHNYEDAFASGYVPYLKTLKRLTTHDISAKSLKSLPALKSLKLNSKLKKSLLFHLKSLHSLEISEYESGIVIHSLLFLRELKVTKLTGGFELRGLPRLRLLQLQSQQIVLKTGVTFPNSLVLTNNLKLQNLEFIDYRLEVDLTPNLLTGDAWISMIQGLNLNITCPKQLAVILEYSQNSLEHLEFDKFFSKVKVTPSQIRYLSLLNIHPSPDQVPATIQLLSNSLQFVALRYPKQKLNIICEIHLKVLKIFSTHVTIQGNGRIDWLNVDVFSLNHPDSQILKTVRNITIEESESAQLFDKFMRLDSVERIYLNNFQISTLDSLLRSAGRLKELYLKGKELKGVEHFALECGTLQLLKIEELEEVKGILIKKEQKNDLTVLKSASDINVVVEDI